MNPTLVTIRSSNGKSTTIDMHEVAAWIVVPHRNESTVTIYLREGTSIEITSLTNAERDRLEKAMLKGKQNCAQAELPDYEATADVG